MMDTKRETRRAWAEQTIARGGGLMAYGQGLGVFVGAADRVSSCPPGWIFVDVNDTTVDQIVEAMEMASKGMKAWPKSAP